MGWSAHEAIELFEAGAWSEVLCPCLVALDPAFEIGARLTLYYRPVRTPTGVVESRITAVLLAEASEPGAAADAWWLVRFGARAETDRARVFGARVTHRPRGSHAGDAPERTRVFFPQSALEHLSTSISRRPIPDAWW